MSNKLVIFDLDGVLIDSKDLHYKALNHALEEIDYKYIISYQEHLSRYDGLNTRKKLSMLTKEKGLPQESHETVWQLKQEQTFKMLENLPVNNNAINIMLYLKSKGWKIAVASNSIRETIIKSLHGIKVLHLVDYIVSNEDVWHPKPHPEMYWKCMVALDAFPKDTIIIEDSHIGRQGALNSGANYEKYNLKQLLNLIAPDCDIVIVDGMTEGAACTTLLAKHLIDSDKPLLMANSDQYVEWDSNEALYEFSASNADGGILSFKATHPKWSFAKTGEDGFVSEVAEKNPISDNATVGIYYWKHGSDYVKYANQMIDKNVRTNNEFYVCPVFNEAIQDGKKVRLKMIDKMWGIGTPEDLNYFLENNK